MTIWEQTISKEECQNNYYFLPFLECFEYIWTQLIENIIYNKTNWMKSTSSGHAVLYQNT